jgi:glycine cleavage system regulatory protein
MLPGMHDLVLTLIGPDRPGLVEAVAALIANHRGNWLESRMTRLAGKFAGILRAELPADSVSDALRALGALEAQGVRVTAEATPRIESPAAAVPIRMRLELVGVDRPGIVREVSQLLANHGVNVEELVTDRVSAPMSGEMLFVARANVAVPASTDLSGLRTALERTANDLMVDLKLEEEKGSS